MSLVFDDSPVIGRRYKLYEVIGNTTKYATLKEIDKNHAVFEGDDGTKFTRELLPEIESNHESKITLH